MTSAIRLPVPTGAYTLDLRNPAGLLNYNQNIGAGYLSYTLSYAKKYTIKVGSRFEHTSIDANDQERDIIIPSYSNLVPSVNISKSIGKASTMKLAYNKRIQRPGLQQLNPNFNAANPQNINIGNPTLRPELTDNLELSLSTSIKKTYLTVALFGRQTSNAITRITTPSDTLIGALITTYQNIGKEQTYGANVFGNVFLTSKWTLNGGVDMYYNYLEGRQVGLIGYLGNGEQLRLCDRWPSAIAAYAAQWLGTSGLWWLPGQPGTAARHSGRYGHVLAGCQEGIRQQERKPWSGRR